MYAAKELKFTKMNLDVEQARKKIDGCGLIIIQGLPDGVFAKDSIYTNIMFQPKNQVKWNILPISTKYLPHCQSLPTTVTTDIFIYNKRPKKD